MPAPNVKAGSPDAYDSQLEQIEILTGATPKIVLADRGYRSVGPACGARLLISHTRRLPERLKKLPKRRRVVEPMIGHMKADGLLSGAGRNLRMILGTCGCFIAL